MHKHFEALLYDFLKGKPNESSSSFRLTELDRMILSLRSPGHKINLSPIYTPAHLMWSHYQFTVL